MDISHLRDSIKSLFDLSQSLNQEVSSLQQFVTGFSQQAGVFSDPLFTNLTIFILACFVGYYVVWNVTPALHSPLMSVTNAISSIVIVGALIAAGPALFDLSSTFGLLGIFIASINIFGGFLVTRRMLSMFSKSR